MLMALGLARAKIPSRLNPVKGHYYTCAQVTGDIAGVRC